jgi:oligopeptide/dipeptide ABC transporter ATP-binding protein
MRRQKYVRAVDDVSLYLHRGETLGIIGESGSGKTTLARTILRLLPPDHGQLVFAGEDITDHSERALRRIRHRMQPVFQDPHGSLAPTLSVLRAIGEGVMANPSPNLEQSVREVSLRWMARVGLASHLGERRPDQLSAGERQRVAIARALAPQPDLLICDEPLNALDVSVRAQVVNLLLDLQSEYGLSYLFISHDLRIVRYVSHRIAVMYLGRIVETGPAADVCEVGLHPYTRALVSSTPLLSAKKKRLRVLLEYAAPGPATAGCAFHPRCPRAEPGVCDKHVPTLRELRDESGHEVACHFPYESIAGSAGQVANQPQELL